MTRERSHTECDDLADREDGYSLQQIEAAPKGCSHCVTGWLTGLAYSNGQQQIRPQRLITRLNRQHMISGIHRIVEIPA
jgi:hypothetical protein